MNYRKPSVFLNDACGLRSDFGTFIPDMNPTTLPLKTFSAPPKLQFDRRLNVALYQASAPIELTKADDGTASANAMKIFKSGTFKDSMGFQHTWEPEHLQQMVFHYDLLKSKGTFPNVPWRVDHSFSVDKVCGYIDKLYVQENFLLADVSFTEPTAIEKIERGTYRNRSAEVGLYETNDEAFYWPVIMGVAFVDLAAVEGLYGQATAPRTYTVLTEGDSVPDPIKPPADPANPPPNPPAPTPPTPPQPPNPAPPQQHTFACGGQQINDFGRVQQYISQLETRVATLDTFRSEQLETARVNFVNQLAKDNKIGAPQVEGLVPLVKTFSDEQWEGFKKTWEGAPPAGIFGKHNGVTNPDNTAQNTEPTEKETLEEIVAMHRRAGMTDEQIAKTPSAVKLAAFNGKN